MVIAYHASMANNIATFDSSKIRRLGDYGPGFYFATDIGDIKTGHGVWMYRVDLNVSNPLVIGENSPSNEEMEKLYAVFGVNEETRGFFEGHPAVELFALLEHAYPISVVRRGMTKLGYDSVLVENAVINERTPGKTGNYWVVWSTERIAILDVARIGGGSWAEYDGENPP